MSEEDRAKVLVARVVCDKCKHDEFKLYRKLSDKVNYFLVCSKCGHTKEFRVFLIWDADVKKTILPKGDMSFLDEIEKLGRQREIGPELNPT